MVEIDEISKSKFDLNRCQNVLQALRLTDLLTYLLTHLFTLTYLLIHIIKVICYSLQDNVQTSFCMFNVAMETLTNKVKIKYCILLDIFLLFPKIQTKVSIQNHTRTNTKLLL